MSARPLILARLTACELPDASATARAGRESSEHERTVEQRLRSDAAGTDTDDDDADTLALSKHAFLMAHFGSSCRVQGHN